MSTTSLKLPDALKNRAAAAARTRGVSMHAFMLDAVRQATEATEKRAAFLRDAGSARKALLKTGKGYAAEDVHRYLRAKVRGKAPTRPKPTSWRG